ncbi:hypothetical protein TNIN_245281 [Trichonephila inaurata madagascariensis]|uniref:Zinc-finger CCCH domain-containing protein n=1 Tax=Trichonephila inaurata madagascariensis TaxID=2747483 RepID=A0A8X6Y2Q1_9ARAC|nr:hypothetical protein TNIN_245281 [Trichonephila inaurata madagascariensis]
MISDSESSINRDFSPTKNTCEKLRDTVKGISAIHHNLQDEGRFRTSSPRNSFLDLYRMNVEAMLKKKEDLGKKCPYRHCEQARITHIECPRFVQRKCNAITCRFRHTVDKENIFCFFENVSGGCKKPICAFKHTKKNNFKVNPYLYVKKSGIQAREKNSQTTLSKKIVITKRITKVEDKRKCVILMPLKKKKRNSKPISVSDLHLQKKIKKYSLKDRQPFIDCSNVLVSPTMPAIPDTVDNTTLSINSVSLSCNLKENQDQSADVSKEPVSNSGAETKKHEHVSVPVSLTSDEDEIISSKKIKPENAHGSILDDFVGLLDYEDMDVEETEISPDHDILLEVEQFLNS